MVPVMFPADTELAVAAFAAWLEIGVRTNGCGAFDTLTPRQKVTATPYAIQAANAATASSVAAGNITGTILNASLPTSPNYSGTVTATSFSGSGAGVTAVNAGNISSGTLSDARLSGNVALLNASQTFTGANTFNNPANSFNGTHTGSGAALTNLNLMNAVPGWAVTLSTNINSNPAFTLASAPLSGTTPKCVLAVDLNGDGKLDLISANEGDSTLTVRTNNGSGAYVLSATLGAVLLDTGAFFQIGRAHV